MADVKDPKIAEGGSGLSPLQPRQRGGSGVIEVGLIMRI